MMGRARSLSRCFQFSVGGQVVLHRKLSQWRPWGPQGWSRVSWEEKLDVVRDMEACYVILQAIMKILVLWVMWRMSWSELGCSRLPCWKVPVVVCMTVPTSLSTLEVWQFWGVVGSEQFSFHLCFSSSLSFSLRVNHLGLFLRIAH